MAPNCSLQGNPLHALGLALAITMTLGTGTVAARPETGMRDIQDLAQSSFQTRLPGFDDCLYADISVSYFAGDNLQSPIGSGKPGSWSDVAVILGVFDSCNQDAEVMTLKGLGFPMASSHIDRLERATLDVVMTICDRDDADTVGCPSNADVLVPTEIHLLWLGNDDQTVRIEHDLSSGYFRQERYETATVSGTVQLGAAPLWDELTFTGGQAHDARIATANEISLP